MNDSDLIEPEKRETMKNGTCRGPWEEHNDASTLSPLKSWKIVAYTCNARARRPRGVIGVRRV